MKKMVVIMSHPLTEEQKEDARNSLGVTKFVALPEPLLGLWSNVPPDLNKEETREYVRPILEWCYAQGFGGEAIFLVHGQPGAQNTVVNIVNRTSGTCYYATTKRVYVETINPDGSVTKSSVFKHVRFVEY